MWQRFTERARRVILLAQEEARKMNSSHVGTEHLLLGIGRENEGVAAQVLTKMGLSLERVREEIEAEIEKSEAPPGSEPTLTSRAKRVLELAADEARRMKHNYIGSEHLLLALLREKDGVAANVLRKLGLNLEKARTEVMEYLGPESPQSEESPTPSTSKYKPEPHENTDWILTILSRLMPPELRELETTLRHLKADEANAVAKGDYETAAQLQQRANYIEHRIEEFVDKWETAMQEGIVPTPDFMGDFMVSLITQIENAISALQANDEAQINEAKANLDELKQQIRGDNSQENEPEA